MKFTLTIELGNDAMRTRYHLQNALKRVAHDLTKTPTSALKVDEGGKIRDANGNTVGEWKMEE